MPATPHRIRLAAVAALAGSLGLADAAFAQAPAPAGPQGVKLARPGRVPLLPEGVVLEGAVGTIAFDPEDAVWVFRPRVSEQGLGRALILLPGEVRSDLVEALGVPPASPETSGEYEIFGRVYTHRGRNYLLASGVNRIEPAAAPSIAEAPAAAESVPSGAVDPADDAFLEEGDDLSAQLEAELVERAGRAPRSVAVEQAGAAEVLVREHRIHRRRGHLRRDVVTGTLLFVPEADGTGARDPQYELLPCRELERLEAFAARAEAPRILRVSGLVIEEGSRRFLLPSAFAVPREGRGIGP